MWKKIPSHSGYQNWIWGSFRVSFINFQRITLFYILPAISNFKVIEAVVGVKTVAFCVTGTNPAFVTSSSCWPAQTPRAVKKPLTFVWARMLYGVSANDMFASKSGISSPVKILPVSRWWEHVQASQAAFSVPIVQFLEQSGTKSFTLLKQIDFWSTHWYVSSVENELDDF